MKPKSAIAFLTVTLTTATTLIAVKPATAAPTLVAQQQCDSNYHIPIQFQPGTSTARIFSKATFCTGIKRYVLRAYGGQTMTVNVNSPDSPFTPSLTIYGADGSILVRSVVHNSRWSGTLPKTEDYYINVVSDTNHLADYNLDVTIH
ncbi:MAG TPA: hypothetical protein V6C85_24485 [Allocoleopsis sp.]